jgi:hypothetical protein
MTRSPWPRKTANLSDSIHHHLNTYALAATAAGVGMLAQSAEARVVYTPAYHLIGKNAHYRLDLNHDGITDFTFVNSYGCNFDYCFDVLNANAAAGNGVVGNRGFLSIPYAFVLRPGSGVGPKKPFSGQLMASSNMGTLGRWLNVNGGYLGLRFDINGTIHYGWARLNVHLTNGVFEALLTGYAYETTPNKPIIAGKTEEAEEGSVDEANPATLNEPTLQPASLGLLAMGSPGLSVWRREESVLAAPEVK